MRPVLPLLIPLTGCLPADLGAWLGYEETAAEWGIARQNSRGVCVGDLDGDRDEDLVFTSRDGLLVYRNLLDEGEAGFAEITEEAGFGGQVGELAAGCALGDVDGDGDADLVLTCNRDASRLFLNDGAGRFADGTEGAGLGDNWGQSSAVFEDVDRDGRLDLLLAGAWDGRTRLWRNLGEGRFLDRTPEVLREVEHSWGGAFLDVDDDGLPELFLGTDGSAEETPDRLLANRGDFAFEDVSEEAGIGNTLSAMAIAVGDPDADGALDFFVTNIGERPLWRNDGAGRFVDVALSAGVAGDQDRSVGWASFFFDPDDDGRWDLFEARGDASLPLGSMDNWQPWPDSRNRLYLAAGEGPDGFPRWRDAARAAGLADSGSALGAAWADLDGDGRLDLVVANHAEGADRVYRNLGHDGADPGRLRLRLRGGAGNPDAVGARVEVETCGRESHALRGPGPGFLSQGEPTLHFGLGGCAEPAWVQVTWPAGERSEHTIDRDSADRGAVRLSAP